MFDVKSKSARGYALLAITVFGLASDAIDFSKFFGNIVMSDLDWTPLFHMIALIGGSMICLSFIIDLCQWFHKKYIFKEHVNYDLSLDNLVEYLSRSSILKHVNADTPKGNRFDKVIRDAISNGQLPVMGFPINGSYMVQINKDILDDHNLYIRLSNEKNKAILTHKDNAKKIVYVGLITSLEKAKEIWPRHEERHQINSW